MEEILDAVLSIMVTHSNSPASAGLKTRSRAVPFLKGFIDAGLQKIPETRCTKADSELYGFSNW
jgi:hypothetical protein